MIDNYHGDIQRADTHRVIQRLRERFPTKVQGDVVMIGTNRITISTALLAEILDDLADRGL